ncbi:MAG: trans-aconitate 2-methyltransferase [Bdellovibrionales bacterium]
MLIIYCIVVVFLGLVVLCELYTLRTGVPTITSLPSVRKKMIQILKDEGARKILDLGSGTGKLCLEIGHAIPEASVTGVELSLVPSLLSKIRRLLWGAKNVAFERANFWPYDVSDVDAVIVYINDHIRQRMAEKLKAELPKGTLVLSNETHLEGWTPLATHEIGLLKTKLVVYRS